MSEPESILSKRSRNELYKAIEESGIEPRLFSLDPHPKRGHGDRDHLTIHHDDTGARLVIEGPDPRSVIINFRGPVPADAGVLDVRATNSEGVEQVRIGIRWQGVLDCVRAWSAGVKTVVEAPDLWSDLAREADEFYNLGTVDNTPFSEAELKEIAEALNGLKLYAKRTYSLSSEESREIEARLDYLIAASRRVGRLDWRNLAVGALLSAVAGALLPQPVMQGVLRAFISSVGHIFGINIPQLPG
ncbi:MAG TPA: hypothetical protein VK701_07315 [Solirubrobacteraceae bacterium]|nr:hypothetical protein [Solirubrobacteraceae bacterium]